MDEFFELIGLLLKAPSVSYGNSTTMVGPDGEWIISFSSDVDHPVGWRVVQKFADLRHDPSRNGGIAMFYPSPRDEETNSVPGDECVAALRGVHRQWTPKDAPRCYTRNCRIRWTTRACGRTLILDPTYQTFSTSL